MKFKPEKKYIYITLSVTAGLCIAILFYYILFHGINLLNGVTRILTILAPVIDGLIIAYMLCPVVNIIEAGITKYSKKLFGTSDKKENTKAKAASAKDRLKPATIRSISVFITIIIFLLCIYIILQSIIPQLIDSITGLANNMPSYADKIEKWGYDYIDKHEGLKEIFDSNNMLQSVTASLNSFTEEQITRVPEVLKTLSEKALVAFKFVGNIIIGLIISIYLLNSKEQFKAQLKKLIYAVFSKKTADDILIEASSIHKIFGGFLLGKIIDSIIIGIICFIGATIMKLPYALLISIIVGVTNIIPYFGPFIGAVPSALLILLVNPKQCLYFVIFIIILQQIDGNIIGPTILGSSTGLSSFWVIFAITIFGGIFGVPGMFIGVPLFAVILNALKRLAIRGLKAKNMPVNTDSYSKYGLIQTVVSNTERSEKEGSK